MKTGLPHWKQIATGLLLLGIAAAASGFSSCNSSGMVTLGPVQVNPTTISMTCPTTSATFTAFQLGFLGTFTAQSADTTHVTVQATTPPGTFLVQDGINANGSTTNITVTGGGNLQNTVSVTALGCPCVRHHDMWDACPLKSQGKKR